MMSDAYAWPFGFEWLLCATPFSLLYDLRFLL